MPCLILTGHPSVGKTTLANIIKERALQHSSKRITSVLIVNEELACPGISKEDCYATSLQEKKTRGALKAKFDQAILVGGTASQKNQLVILDSLNYIKGFRYELHCISKSAGEIHGIIWVLNSPQVAKEWNQKRRSRCCSSADDEGGSSSSSKDEQQSQQYSDQIMEELILRYEPPDERNRWDKPLYKVDMTPQEIKKIQKLKSQEQQNAGGGGGGGETEGEILKKSVYNMHALSDVMGNGTTDSTSTTTTTDKPASSSAEQDGAAAVPQQPTKKKKGFKGFKRANKKTVQATVVASPSAAAESTTTTPESNTASSFPTAARGEEAVMLFPKNFLYSSQPSEEDIGTNNGPENQNNEQQQRDNSNNPRFIHKTNNKDSASAPPPPKPDPMTSVQTQVDAILDAFLLHVKPLQEGTSTRSHVAVNANVLHEMDVITTKVCDAIIMKQQQQALSGGGRIPIILSSSSTEQQKGSDHVDGSTSADDDEQQLFLETKGRPITNQLQQLRQQYLRWVSTHPPEHCDTEYGIAKSFVSYLEAQL